MYFITNLLKAQSSYKPQAKMPTHIQVTLAWHIVLTNPTLCFILYHFIFYNNKKKDCEVLLSYPQGLAHSRCFSRGIPYENPAHFMDEKKTKALKDEVPCPRSLIRGRAYYLNADLLVSKVLVCAEMEGGLRKL